MTPQPKPDTDFPWWLVIVVITGLFMYGQVLTSELHAEILTALSSGIWITIMVSVVAYAGACALGLGLALMGLSRWIVVRQAARLYIEVMRGIPIIVLLLYIAFVFVPALIAGWNALGLPEARTRDIPLLWRAVLALVLAYAAFLAEIFRAGLQAVDPGQIEAAKALGLSRWQRFRHIAWPQAFRLILPPLGNDFVAMVKDSSLVSVLGVLDITALGRIIQTSNFRVFETYNVVALLYLTMTISLSIVLRRLETRLRQKGKTDDQPAA